jgi:LysR family transcriptional regulator (chromosome initiation inhibitor)
MLDYKLIEALAMVAREGSFEKAAGVLFITQSAVSQRVKLLEEQMGQVLLARTVPCRPTPAGRKLLKHYLQVRRLEEELLGETGDAAGFEFTSIAVGINADSLALWLLDAIHPFLLEERVLLDIRVDDQEQTHRLLRDGDVVGCISTREQPMQGCSVEYLGRMTYRMVAAPGFVARWFEKGFSLEGVAKAPALIFDRKDDLHHKFLRQAFGEIPAFPAHYVPSVEKYAQLVTSGIAYGMLPDQQLEPLMPAGQVVDLLPGCQVSVTLYWHCWSLKSRLLNMFTRHLLLGAKNLLEQ